MTRVYYLIFCLLLCCGSSYGQSSKVLNQNISIIFQKDSLSIALFKLQNAVQGDFAFDPLIVPADKFITQSFVKKDLGHILDQLLEGTDLTYTIIGKALVIIKKPIETFTIKGHIRDKDTGEELMGASIYIKSLRTGAITNQYGFYSITIPAGYYEVAVSYLGYTTSVQTVQLSHNLLLDYSLSIKVYDLVSVHIEPNITDSAYAHTSAKNIRPDVLNRLVYYAGEVDVVKALQMQSGIKALTEGSSGLFVRGGSNDQNLITLDEALIYNPSHLFGLVSVFNSDAIKNIKIYDDHMPANYGGRLSSVIDVRMADGNNKEFHVNGGVSLLSLKVAAEGPIKKEVGSFLITFRRSLIDLLDQNLKIFNQNSTYYDFNLKANYQLNTSNRVFYSLYYGNDFLSSKNSYVNFWGNATSTFRWNHEFNSRIFFNLSAIYSNYSNLLDVNADTISEKYRWKTGIKDMSLKGDFTFYKTPLSEIQFGGVATLHQIIPGEATNVFPVDFNIPKDRALESSLYVSHQLSLKNKFKLNYGLRAGLFSNGEERTNLFDSDGNKIKAKSYSQFVGLEPRVYLSFALNRAQRLHATYNHNYQYLQLIQNNELAFSSLETWMSSSKATKPQRSDYWSAGYDYFSTGNRFVVDVYYKKMENQLDLINHTQIIKNPDIRDQLRSGTSNAYGLNMGLSKTIEKFSADASYSYSRVFRRINDINDGIRFPANFDIPHDFKLTMSYSVNDHFSMSSFFNYYTGRVVTLPVGYYQHDGIQVPIFEKRNDSRFPDYHRLDVSAQYHLNSSNAGKHPLSSTFSAGLYNVYNRKNPLFYRVKQASTSDSLFEFATGAMPWIAYSFKF
jgi:hypothetical protein